MSTGHLVTVLPRVATNAVAAPKDLSILGVSTHICSPPDTPAPTSGREEAKKKEANQMELNRLNSASLNGQSVYPAVCWGQPGVGEADLERIQGLSQRC